MVEHLEIAKRLLKEHEGLCLVAYDDATGEPLRPGYTLVGHPTVGYGRALDLKGLSPLECEALLKCDIDDASEIAIDFAGPAWQFLTPARKAVLIDMAHNLGPGGLHSFVGLQMALSVGDYALAEAEMLDSLWARQVPRRATRLAKIMARGEE